MVEDKVKRGFFGFINKETHKSITPPSLALVCSAVPGGRVNLPGAIGGQWGRVMCFLLETIDAQFGVLLLLTEVVEFIRSEGGPLALIVLGEVDGGINSTLFNKFSHLLKT